MTKLLATTLAATLGVAAWATPALAQLAPPAEPQDVRVGGRLQLMGLGEWLERESFRSQGRVVAFLKQSRLDVAARRGDLDLYAQLALGGEDVYTSNVNLTLLDMYAAGPLLGDVRWRLGQFRVPYGRELMTNGGSLAFWDRSIVAPFLQVGRDVGAALQGQAWPVALTGGVFLGGGRGVPPRYLPEILGIPLLVARAGIGDVDEAPNNLKQHDHLEVDRTRQAVHWSGLFTRDSRVGHSTVLNVKNGFEKSLLLSPAWNPYIAKKDPVTNEAPQGELFQTGVDYALRHPTDLGTLTGEAEVSYGRFANAFGSLGVLGGRAQAGLYRAPFEAAVRYAVLVPDAGFATTNTTAGSPTLGQATRILPDGAPIQEITPALTYFLDGDRFKLLVDFPVQLGAPVVLEKGIGSYNLVNQPDQAALLTTPAHTLSRQLVFQVRAGLQYAF